MKKISIAAIVGSLILFLYQFVSWNLSGLHSSEQRYTPQQEKIMTFLNGLQLEEGGYILPTAPPNATMDEWNKMMETSAGKPWAKIQYHSALQESMAMNMVRGVIINILTVLLLCWVLRQFRVASLSNILLASLCTGLIVFFNAPYTHAIWYQDFDVWGHLADAVFSWGLVGLWLGWYLKEGRSSARLANSHRRSAVINID